jgi:hypothetical protein
MHQHSSEIDLRKDCVLAGSVSMHSHCHPEVDVSRATASAPRRSCAAFTEGTGSPKVCRPTASSLPVHPHPSKQPLPTGMACCWHHHCLPPPDYADYVLASCAAPMLTICSCRQRVCDQALQLSHSIIISPSSYRTPQGQSTVYSSSPSSSSSSPSLPSACSSASEVPPGSGRRRCILLVPPPPAAAARRWRPPGAAPAAPAAPSSPAPAAMSGAPSLPWLRPGLRLVYLRRS